MLKSFTERDPSGCIVSVIVSTEAVATSVTVISNVTGVVVKVGPTYSKLNLILFN